MKLKNPIAKELRTPKFKSKVIENKKKKLEDDDKHTYYCSTIFAKNTA